MPAMANGTHHSPRVRNGEPQPAPVTTPEPASARRDLTSWWRTFSKRAVKKEEEKGPVHASIFGVSLIQSIPYANVAISLFNEQGESYIYGYVPIVVAKCGVFLKEKATDVEGIFRLSGSEKRIKELKTAFDTPPRYGKGLDWTGYTVHDAANILRRYFNFLPEPIIPLAHYDPFRQPLRNHQAEAVGPIEGQAPSLGGFDPDAAVRTYQLRIKELPSLNRQLLLYILDLLAVFAAKADVNKMTTSNLASIFQPGILSHPKHEMSPQDYRLSQDVLIFLIDNQDHFLIGMEGTAVDEGTVKHVESGPPTPQASIPTTPARDNSGVVRSSSTTSSAGADSLRQHGGIRRNVSTSSKRSRHSGAIPSPLTPAFTTPTSSGVHRSNTLPSKRSPAIGSPRFPKGSGPSTPVAEAGKSPLSFPTSKGVVASALQAEQPVQEPVSIAEAAQLALPAAEQTQPAQPTEGFASPTRAQTLPPQRIDLPTPFTHVEFPQNKPTADLSVTPAIHAIPGGFPLSSPHIIPPSEAATPNVPVQANHQGTQELSPPTMPVQGTRSPRLTPTRDRSEFLEAPLDSPPDSLPLRTFTQILGKAGASPTSEARKPNKLQKKRVPSSTNPSAHSSTHSLPGGLIGIEGAQVPPGIPSPLHPPQPQFAQGQSHSNSSREALHSYNADTVSSRNSGVTLKPTMSPSASFRSHSTATEYSEAELAEEPQREEKRSFWKGHKRGESRATPTASQTDLHGSVPGGDKSMSSFGSSSGWGGGGRRSLQYDSQQSSETSMMFGSPPDHERSSEKKGPLAWVTKRMQDHKERTDKRERARSPQGNLGQMPNPIHVMRAQQMQTDRTAPQSPTRPYEAQVNRGRAMEVPRSNGEESNDVTPTGSSSHAPTVQSASEMRQLAPSAAAIQQEQQSPPPINTSTAIQPATEASSAHPANTVSEAQPYIGAPAVSHAQPATETPVAHPTSVTSESHPYVAAPVTQSAQSAETNPTGQSSLSRPPTANGPSQPATTASTSNAAPMMGLPFEFPRSREAHI
ncbi:RhoGAP-domain-containing protein [Dothidotthia symphoricarpi CBS 119687]|uniref:RhoGAP-domain-containing protein n=1 Tax=Dothidotthia symphoricarpi CBS 119687 TaxID=1392245 RepID=A0A6A6A3K1_9PLEO|nr:RhoGAP-domain-containing protein [Dothidotthia symphoricarpi CBS 119687]KAF2126380.1 RhoGAP-domain-containing protein [Dothidotthia symphoricarpi CBS 119687]